ncbi:TPA: fertility inhibition protein FinO [Klebsiella quasipneumoniae subsp. quasipneumoniae]|uniref:fertility inhibition protein FinO n=1 Tax=Klebsiella/Raoultella group TaxID=2890311 RepID=UPI000B4C8AEA|nr:MULTISPECIES: fertility inhibition protein FinO [Klebsiella/Raoultella group]HCI7054646.1 fertility inhibition protein FinO [Klebsiella quasipneumoniae subsp. quasipneumoniae]HDH1773544.1 fertility inhibition protein FinO [Klebsiella quasipneumoniae subsp. similipneumoniae]OWP37463.1 conjugal transfer protein [Raoultella ornithinolytica]OWP47298.1 conjugal transfer protein [Raoultella ornithinolytica]TYX76521.1 fertility inhibition protein FinO [Klebsiella pneumoniae]
MTEEKRPTLSLKKKPAERSTGTEPESPRIVRRKQVVNVTTPPAWKVKKEKLARKAEQIASAEPVPPEPASPEKANRKIRYLRLPALQVAIDTLQPWWPALFDGDKPRLLATGIRETIFNDIASRGIPLSHKQVIKCLKRITRSEQYLSSMIAGAERVDLNGTPVSVVTPDEEQYAMLRMEKQRRQQARIQSDMV